jgi:branched-chain amino acid transport system substrate-binding protein
MFGDRRRRRALSVGLIALAVLAAGCSSSTKTASAGGGSTGATGGTASAIPAGDIVFGETLPLSGVLAQTGSFEQFSVNSAVAALNQFGGIAGHQVKVITLDDKGDPATALANAETLVKTDHVAAILNGSLGAGSELTVPYFMKLGIPTVLAEANTGFLDVSKYPSYFTPYSSATQYAQEYVAFAKARGLTNVGTLSDGTPISQDTATAVAQQAPAAGLTVSKEVTYSPTAADLTTPILQLKNAGVKLLVVAGFTAIANIYTALHQVGWTPTVVGISISEAPVTTMGAAAASSYYLCNYYNTASPGAQPTGAAKAVIDKMEPQYGQSTTTSGALGWYDILLTLKAGIERAKSTDYAAVIKGIESAPIPSVWPGITYTYTASDHEGWQSDQTRLCGVTPLGPGGVGIAVAQS